jgi:hypothetical protein
MHGLLPNMTAEEKKILAEKEKETDQEPEKRELDETAQEEAATSNVVEKAHPNGITA